MAHAPKKLAIDCLKYYELERYLFDEVYRRFRAEGSLGAFDFFSIINWTARRAKSHIASALLKANTRKPRSLEAITRRLTSAIHNAKNSKERFRVVTVDWRLPLPTASAILAVCCPDEFIVFDYRVRELIDFRELNYYGTSFETLWRAYMEYQAEVASAAPAPLSLADKNRYLRGGSAALRLEDEISRLFSKRAATPKTPRRRRASRA